MTRTIDDACTPALPPAQVRTAIVSSLLRLWLPSGDAIPAAQLSAATGYDRATIELVLRTSHDVAPFGPGWIPTMDLVRRTAASVLDASNLQTPFLVEG